VAFIQQYKINLSRGNAFAWSQLFTGLACAVFYEKVLTLRFLICHLHASTLIRMYAQTGYFYLSNRWFH